MRILSDVPTAKLGAMRVESILLVLALITACEDAESSDGAGLQGDMGDAEAPRAAANDDSSSSQASVTDEMNATSGGAMQDNPTPERGDASGPTAPVGQAEDAGLPEGSNSNETPSGETETPHDDIADSDGGPDTVRGDAVRDDTVRDDTVRDDSESPEDAGTTDAERFSDSGRNPSPEGGTPFIAPCMDYACDVDVVRLILDVNGHVDIEVSNVIGAQATNTRVSTLYLTDVDHFGALPNGVSVLPPEIGRLSGLDMLYLTDGSLTELPAEMANLTNLTRLDVIEQDLDHFPMVLLDLPNLTHLTLDGVPIAELPREIDEMTMLGSLWMNGTLLEALPDELTNLTSLYQMSFVSGRLARLPEAIGNLTALSRLYFWNNQLESLPASITQLTLSDLRVGSNRLCRVPESVANWLDEYAEVDWDQQQFSDAEHTTPCEVIHSAE